MRIPQTPQTPQFRVGQGIDVHAFEPGRPLVLGGVEIPSQRGGLRGHSDADVLTHVVASALLGSLALGDLGTHFPDDDPRYQGVSSRDLLQQAYALVRQRGFLLVNCDATIIAQEPRLAPFIASMRRNLASSLSTDLDAISVQATTAERLGALGRSEGIAARAVVLVCRAE